MKLHFSDIKPRVSVWVGWGHCADLVAVDHEMVCCRERLEDHHPAGAGGPLEQGVSQLGYVDVHLIGALDQVWRTQREGEIGHCVCVCASPPPLSLSISENSVAWVNISTQRSRMNQ